MKSTFQLCLSKPASKGMSKSKVPLSREHLKNEENVLKVHVFDEVNQIDKHLELDKLLI